MAKYDNVVIIGNGFDLSLGLKTIYSHFLEHKPCVNVANAYNAERNILCSYLIDSKTKFGWIDTGNEK